MTASEATDALRSVLQSVKAAVESFNALTGNAKDAEYNVCVMVPVFELRTDDMNEVRFVDEGRDLEQQLLAVLCVEHWAERKPVLRDIVLPVEDPDNEEYCHQQLFGAPAAFVSGQVQFIDDVRTLRRRSGMRGVWDRLVHGPALSSEISEGVCLEVQRYFGDLEGHVRSFVSIPVPLAHDDAPSFLKPYSEHAVAVVNVQSNRCFVFGRHAQTRRVLLGALSPFLTLVARYTARIRVLEARDEDNTSGSEGKVNRSGAHQGHSG
jgi:hypothetical protein